MSPICPTENEIRRARWLLVLIAMRACRSYCAWVRKVLQWITLSMFSALGTYWTQEVHMQWRIQVPYGFVAMPKLIQWFVNWLALVMSITEYCHAMKNLQLRWETKKNKLHPSELVAPIGAASQISNTKYKITARGTGHGRWRQGCALTPMLKPMCTTCRA